MTRCTPILILCVALLSACGSPRKACRKADRHIARAVWLCPDVLHQDSATVTWPPTSDTIAAQPSRPDLDSLLAACRTLNIALQAARLHAAPPLETHTPISAAPSVKHAVAKVQAAACNWEGFTERVGRVTITVHNIDGTPVLLVDDPGEVRKVPCPPGVTQTVVTGVAGWYRPAFWILAVLLVLIYINDARRGFDT